MSLLTENALTIWTKLKTMRLTVQAFHMYMDKLGAIDVGCPTIGLGWMLEPRPPCSQKFKLKTRMIEKQIR